jgi:hypothetical protein
MDCKAIGSYACEERGSISRLALNIGSFQKWYA